MAKPSTFLAAEKRGAARFGQLAIIWADPYSGSLKADPEAETAAAVKAAAGLAMKQGWTLDQSGAGEGIRTLDPDLGKVVLYH